MSRSDEDWMQEAILAARENPSAPFGAVIVEAGSDRVCARGTNHSREDPTEHGEMAAIRAWFSSGRMRGSGPFTLYTTAEPCPMCAAACVWADIGRVVYGVSIPWLAEHGWHQIGIRASEVFAAAGEPPVLQGDVLADDCAALFLAARPGASS
jgi:tRNA(Arg) A34 adenosine deaminase TadA